MLMAGAGCDGDSSSKCDCLSSEISFFRGLVMPPPVKFFKCPQGLGYRPEYRCASVSSPHPPWIPETVDTGPQPKGPISQFKGLPGEEIFLKSNSVTPQAYSSLQAAFWQPATLQKTEGDK